MANTIQLKRSAVQGNVPTTAQLALGEVGINTFDGKMYIKKDDGAEAIVEIGEPADININLTTKNISTTTTGWNGVTADYGIPAAATGIDNVSLGRAALHAVTGGNNNTAIGPNALKSNLLGGGNVAIGLDALSANPYTIGQIAIGTEALKNSVTDTYSATNIIAGDTVLIITAGTTDFTLIGAPNNTPGTIFTATGPGTGTGTVASPYWYVGGNNTAIGYQTLKTTVSGVNNVAVGNFALLNNLDGHTNIAIGVEALLHNTSGIGNTAIGELTHSANTTGSFNTAVGGQASYSNTTGIENTANGMYALFGNTIGNHNVAVGYATMYCDVLVTAGSFTIGATYVIRTIGTTDFTLIGASTNAVNVVFVATGVGTGTGTAYSRNTSSDNTAIGYEALYRNTIGAKNTTVGYQAGYNIISGSNNTLVGGYQGTSGLTGNVVLSTGDGTVRFQHDGTNWTSATPISTTGLILPSTTSTITLDGSVGTAGQVLTSAGAGATPTWTTTYGPGFVTYTSSATTADQVIDTNTTASTGTVKYTIQVTSGGERHSCEILVTHDGTNTVSTEYAVIDTGAGSLATFNTDINAGNLRLLTTPTNAVTVYKILKTIIAP